MATIEYLQQRVDGKIKELEKLNKKMDRILKAEASGWENNPYYYHESDKKYTARDIEECQKALDNYKDKLAKEQEKANSRNVTAILDFLEAWKARVREYHISSVPAYIEAREHWNQVSKDYAYWWNHGKGFKAAAEEKQQMDREYKEAKKEFYSTWNWLIPYMENDTIDEAMLDKNLKKEADAKYDDIINRTNDIVGTITDATGLRIGKKGDLNGIVIGDRGRAKVQTIGAGGYNIQCYHFRTLIHKA